jgi:crotonobetainyl-CoA:carnitine CoA-transferase CaiB-like acyl-CoA transferase
MTRVLAGPFCTMVLRDLGAKVIKVEPPEGDEARGFGPFLPDDETGNRGVSAYFTSLNCGKRSVVLDLKQASGQTTLAELIRRADVLVENFRPGTLARLGFPPERLRQLNPGLVYAAVSGFGATGPAAQRPAYDMIIQALSGLMSITGTEPEAAPAPAGEAGATVGAGGRNSDLAPAGDVPPAAAAVAPEAGRAGAPAAAQEPGSLAGRAGPAPDQGAATRYGRRVRAGTSIADIVSGLYAAIGIAAALARRAQTGEGAMLDLGMLDATVSVLENAIARYQVSGEVPVPLGTRHPSITPFETFATADDEIVVAAGNDRLFATLCTVLGRPDLASDPRFAGNAARTEHVAELKQELERALERESSAAWLQRLAAAGVPAAPVNTVADLFHEPQLAARGMLLPVTGCDDLLVPGTPLKFAGVATEQARPPAPALGEHTGQVLAELGARRTGGGALAPGGSSAAAGGGPA